MTTVMPKAALAVAGLYGVRASVTCTSPLGRGGRRALEKLRRKETLEKVLLSSTIAPTKNPIFGSQRGGGSEGRDRGPIVGTLAETCTRSEGGEGEEEGKQAAARRAASSGAAARQRSGGSHARILRTARRSVLSHAVRARGARSTHLFGNCRYLRMMRGPTADLWTTTSGVGSGLAADTLVCTVCQDLWRRALRQGDGAKGLRDGACPARGAQGTGSDRAHVARRHLPGGLDGCSREHPARFGRGPPVQLGSHRLDPRLWRVGARWVECGSFVDGDPQTILGVLARRLATALVARVHVGACFRAEPGCLDVRLRTSIWGGGSVGRAVCP